MNLGKGRDIFLRLQRRRCKWVYRKSKGRSEHHSLNELERRKKMTVVTGKFTFVDLSKGKI